MPVPLSEHYHVPRELDLQCEELVKTIERYQKPLQEAFLEELCVSQSKGLSNEAKTLTEIKSSVAAFVKDIVTKEEGIRVLHRTVVAGMAHRMMSQLQTSLTVKALFAAADDQIFNTHFPSLSKNLCFYSYGNGHFARCLVEKCPWLVPDHFLLMEQASELGHVMGALLSCAAELASQRAMFQRDDARVISALISTWHGRTKGGLQAIIEECETYQREYAAHSGYTPVLSLREVLDNFSTNSDELIYQWFNQVYGRQRVIDSVEVAKRFKAEMMPELRHDSRTPRITGVTRTQYLKFLDVMQKSNCWGDFSQFKCRSGSRGLYDSDYYVSGRGGARSTTSEKGFQLLIQLIKKNPNLCENCLEVHMLEECGSVNKKDLQENLGAYIVPDFHIRTNTRCVRYLHEHALLVSRPMK